MKRRIDDIGFGGLRLIQNEDSFCYGTDAVLLADMAVRTVSIDETSRICDLGANTGIISHILAARSKAKEIIGVEIQREAYELAWENVTLNGLDDRLSFVNMNVTDIFTDRQDNFDEKPCLGKASFDIVTTNPPYTEASRGMVSENMAKAIARHELEGGLSDFFGAASYLLKDKGHLFMVHRPSRLIDICESCRNFDLEPKTIRFISGRAGEIPNIMLIHFIKGGRKELRWLKPINVRNDDGSYTDDILMAYEI